LISQHHYIHNFALFISFPASIYRVCEFLEDDSLIDAQNANVFAPISPNECVILTQR